MNKFIGVLAALTCMIATAPNAHAFGGQDDGTFCYPVRGRIDTTFASGCGSPYDLCTIGTSRDYLGLLNGSTTYSAQGLGGGPVGEASILVPATAEPATTWAFGGDFVITTHLGELVLRDVGVFETAIGALAELARIRTGTGIYKDAFGTIFITGETTNGGAGVAARFYGEVCWNTPQP